MNTSKAVTKFYVLANTLVVSVAKSKILIPVSEMVFEVVITQRRPLECESALHAHLMDYITKEATEHYIGGLKGDKTTARAIGGIQWRVAIRDQEFKMFLTRELAQEHMDSSDRPAGPHDRFDFMREMILENFDDSAESVAPAGDRRRAESAGQDEAVRSLGQP